MNDFNWEKNHLVGFQCIKNKGIPFWHQNITAKATQSHTTSKDPQSAAGSLDAMWYGNKLYFYAFNNSLSSETWEASQRRCPLPWDRQWNKRANDTQAQCSMHSLSAQSAIISPWHGDRYTLYLTPRLDTSQWEITTYHFLFSPCISA